MEPSQAQTRLAKIEEEFDFFTEKVKQSQDPAILSQMVALLNGLQNERNTLLGQLRVEQRAGPSTALGGPSLAGPLAEDLQEIKGLLKVQAERQQTQAYVSAMLLSRSSPFREHKTPSSAASNPRLKERLIKVYKLETHRDDKNWQYYRCQVTGETLLSGALVAGHLFPRREAENALDWGIVDPDDDERNGLLWFYGIEKVFSDDQVCLEYDSDTNNLRFRVLNEDLLDKSPVDYAEEKHRKLATERLTSMTFRDLDNKAVYFPADVDVRPYDRVIVSHAAHAIASTWKSGKLRTDINHFVLDVSSDFDQKPQVLAWVRTTMTPVPDWPVGPGLELDVAE